MVIVLEQLFDYCLALECIKTVINDCVEIINMYYTKREESRFNIDIDAIMQLSLAVTNCATM